MFMFIFIILFIYVSKKYCSNVSVAELVQRYLGDIFPAECQFDAGS